MHDDLDDQHVREEVEPGSVISNQEVAEPGSRRLRGMTIAVMIAALLLALGAMSYVSAIMLAPFVSLPLAIVALRYGRRHVIGAAVGLAIVGLVQGNVEYGSWQAATVLVAWFAGYGCVIALAHAAIAPGGRYAGSGLGVLVPLAAWSALTLIVVGAAISMGGGFPSIDDVAVRETRAVYASTLRECRSGGALERANSYCRQLTEQRDVIVRVMRDHAASVLAALLALGVIGSMLTTHVLLALLAPRFRTRAAQLPAPARLTVHWGSPYVLAGGLVAVMATTIWSSIDSPLGAAGVFVATLGMLLMCGQGLGLAWYGLDRGRVRLFPRAILLIASVVAWPFALGILLSLGIIDMALSPRSRNSGTIDGRGSDSL